jgi:peroxiredoxin Q/BCP
MVETGDRAPDFELPDQDGNTHKLSDYEGKNVVLYFYPKALTSGCTVQACGVRDRSADYEAANAVVLGVSPDPQKKLRQFADKENLNFTLLGDEDHAVAEAYDVWVEKSMYGKKYMGMERSTFVIGPDGKIAKVFRKVKPAEHDKLVLGALGS